jgi:hypothetical protein
MMRVSENIIQFKEANAQSCEGKPDALITFLNKGELTSVEGHIT